MSIFSFVERNVIRLEDTSLLSKYRPKRLADVICAEINILCINQWLRQFKKASAPQPFLLISGPAGIGKSLIAELALDEHGYDRKLVVCCSACKSKKDVQRELNDCNAPSTAVIVDNLDDVDNACLDAIKECAKESKATPFILLCEKHTYGKPVEIVKNCEIILLKRPTRQRLLAWADGIARNESIHANVEAIVDQSKGDIRQILLSLELNKGQCSSAKQALLSQKDSNFDAIEITQHLLCSGNPLNTSTSIRLVHTDINIITSMVSENYLDVASVSDIDAVADAADAISAGEVTENKIFGSQQWDLWDTFALLGAVYPASRVRCQNTHPIRFTKAWSRISNMYLRKNIIEGLRYNLRKVDTTIVDTEYLFGLSKILTGCFMGSTSALVSRWGSHIPYETMLFVLRLTMDSALKQTMINKIRKEYEEKGYKDTASRKALK